ncbi:MAG: hypothetical protein K0Q55_1785 [Verrucomicrobia bacterium]|nr:hypothetical protein [Verrucomicrobiota bacterium]
MQARVCYAFYTPSASELTAGQYPFLCLFELHNHFDEALTIQRCKWFFRDSENGLAVVEEEFDFKRFIFIKSWEAFYHKISHMVTSRLTTVEGAYQGIDKAGKPVLFKVPEFEMRVPADLGGGPGKLWV